MANKFHQAITFRGFTLKATEPVGIRAAVDPGTTSLYDGLLLLSNNHPVPLHVPTLASKNPQKFVENHDDRQQTRRNRYFGLSQKALDLKMHTGDDVMIVFRNADKKNFSVVTTSADLKFDPAHDLLNL